jgi:hypothetical protein
MFSAQLFVSIFALIVSAASFAVAQLADIRSRKAEAIRNLLGEKETVAFGGLRLLRDGLPKGRSDRSLVIAALMQACILESSDRARAVLYQVIEENRSRSQAELDQAFNVVEGMFQSMKRYSFAKEEWDPRSGDVRIEAVRKVLRNEAAVSR